MEGRIPTRLSAAEGRKFAFTLTGAFAVFGAIAVWRGHPVTAPILGGLALAFLVGGTFVPTRLSPVMRAWMGLAHLISRVTTPVFLMIVYFIVIAPIGLIMRLLGKNPVRVREADGSFWVSRSDGKGNLTNQF